MTQYVIIPIARDLVPIGVDPVQVARELAPVAHVVIPDSAEGVVIDGPPATAYRVGFTW